MFEDFPQLVPVRNRKGRIFQEFQDIFQHQQVVRIEVHVGQADPLPAQVAWQMVHVSGQVLVESDPQGRAQAPEQVLDFLPVFFPPQTSAEQLPPFGPDLMLEPLFSLGGKQRGGRQFRHFCQEGGG